MDQTKRPTRADESGSNPRATSSAEAERRWGDRTWPMNVMIVGVALTISILLAVYFLRAWF